MRWQVMSLGYISPTRTEKLVTEFDSPKSQKTLHYQRIASVKNVMYATF